MNEQIDQPNATPEPLEKVGAMTPAAEQPPLAPCPCGMVPTALLIEMPERAKYGRTMGDCCSEWAVEFRNGYTQDPELTTQRARDAWNDAPRA